MTTYTTAVLSEELLALRNAAGLINPRDVVAWARRHPRSALYKHLEWDDKTAAEEHRIQQVRRLIAVHIVDDNANRRLVSLSIDRRSGGGYRDVDEVLAQPDLREVMLNDAFVDLRRLKAKYLHLRELVRVWSEADAVEQQVIEKRKKPKKAAPRKKASNGNGSGGGGGRKGGRRPPPKTPRGGGHKHAPEGEDHHGQTPP